jgi:hypothetical protein
MHHYFQRIHLHHPINKLRLLFSSKDDIYYRNFLWRQLAKTTFKDMSAKLTNSVLPSEAVPCEVFLVLCDIIINLKFQYNDGDCIKTMKIFKKEYNQKSIFQKRYLLMDLVPFYYSVVRSNLK